MSKDVPFESLKGQVIDRIAVTADDSEIHFYMVGGKVYKMFHQQDCCESVSIEDVCGEWEDVIHWPLHVAEKRTSDKQDDDDNDSVTWTFYELGTIKGSVTIRWYGSSNGYYSESVDFVDVTEEWTS